MTSSFRVRFWALKKWLWLQVLCRISWNWIRLYCWWILFCYRKWCHSTRRIFEKWKFRIFWGRFSKFEIQIDMYTLHCKVELMFRLGTDWPRWICSSHQFENLLSWKEINLPGHHKEKLIIFLTATKETRMLIFTAEKSHIMDYIKR